DVHPQPVAGARAVPAAARRGGPAGRRPAHRGGPTRRQEPVAPRLMGELMSSTVMLEAKALTKTYFSTDPPTEVLRGIDLSVDEGDFLVIMGASGSGKSTLLYSISGMDRPTDGTVLLA